MTNTTPWRQVTTAHENIKQGRIEQNDFAASLSDVLKGGGNNDYHDPVRFFDRTYLTDGLRQLAGEVVGRLTGSGDGDAVMQIQTPFGGGKTHTLITLYHLVKNGQVCFEHPALAAYRLERGWKTPPQVPVAAFDGNQVGMGAQQLEPSIAVQTMWGHLAWQLAGREGFEIMRSRDADRVSPSGGDIDRLLKVSGGGLIILDEVVNYIERAAGISIGETTLKAQTLTFLQSLTVRAGAHERVVVAATLPKSELEVHGMASANALDRLQKIFGRLQKVREPVEGDEVHEIIRRRLFVPFGLDTDDKGQRTKKSHNREATLTAYMADLKSRPQIPETAKSPEYLKRFQQSYPFHPNLLDILNRYLGANPKFQRTRGVLRLLALVVSDLLAKNHNGGLIQVSDIDLNNAEIRSELLELLDRPFRSVVDAEITGHGSNAKMLDQQMSTQMKSWRLAEGLATTIFLYTCEAGNRSHGATTAELHLASARPEIDKGTIPGVVLQLKERFHFINTEGERFRFTSTPNLNRILLDAKNGIDREEVRKRMEGELRRLLVSKPLAGYIWPESPSAIPDNNQNKLVVMPPERTIDGPGKDETLQAISKILQQSGSSHRTKRNTLIFLIANETEMAQLCERVRSLLAAENVNSNRGRHNLSQDQETQLQNEINNLTKGVRQQVLRSYHHVAWGNKETFKEWDMGVAPSDSEATLTSLVVTFLEEKQKYLKKISPLVLEHPTKLKVWPADEAALGLKDLAGYFRNFTQLPILQNDDVLREAIVAGVKEGRFALCEGRSGQDAKVLHYKESITIGGVFLEEGYVLIRKVLADQKIAEQLARSEAGSVDAGSTGPAESLVKPPEAGSTAPAPITNKKDPTPVAAGKAQRLSLDVTVPFTDFHTFYQGIINPLGRNADQIKIMVQLEATAASGFSPTVVEDTIKETLFNLFSTDEDLRVDE